MAKNTVPEAKEALNRFKMEAASEVGVFCIIFCIKKFQNALFKPLSGLEKKRQWTPNYIKNIKLTKIALHIRKNLSREDTPLGSIFCFFKSNYYTHFIIN